MITGNTSVGGLSVNGAHIRISLTGSGTLWGNLVYARELLVGKRDSDRGDVLLQIFSALGAWDRHDILSLMQQPCQGKLAGGYAFFVRYLFDPIDQLQVLLEVLALKARRGAPEVALRQVLEPLDSLGQEATPQRAVSNKAYIQLAHHRQDLILHVADPQRVLRLQCGYGMYLVRPPYRLGCRLRDTQVTDLPRLDKLLHRPPCLLYGSVRVHPVLVVEVYVLHPQPIQRSVASLAYVLGPSVHAQPSTVLGPLVAELGCERDLIPPGGDCSANEPLVSEGPVHVGSV